MARVIKSGDKDTPGFMSLDGYEVWEATVYYKDGIPETHDILFYRSVVNGSPFVHLMKPDETNLFISSDSIQAISVTPKPHD